MVYKRVVERKIRLNNIIIYWINKINKRMKYMSCWLAVIWSAASGCFDLVWRCYRVTLSAMTRFQISVWPPLALFIRSRLQTPAPENSICGKKKWLKNRPFFITVNFLGILKSLCTEPMRRNHFFLSLTLAVIGSTSGRCHFLQQCRCLFFCVLCVLVVRYVKSKVGESEEIWGILL